MLIAVDRARPVPLRDQLDRELREAIRGGRLPAGSPLPSTRTFAVEVGVSRGVVVEAYAQLAADGLLTTRRGGTTRVADVPVGPAPGAGGGRRRRPPEADPVASDPSARHAARGAAPLDLLPMSGDLGAFPRRGWVRAMRRAVDEISDAGLSYGDPRGPRRARRVLAAYLGRSRGVVANEGTLSFCSGLTDGLGAVGRELAARGVRRVAVEEPGFPVHRATLAAAGLDPVPVAVDDDGLRVSELPDDTGAVLVTAAHQMPTGQALAPQRRVAILRWAAARRAVVLEDDYDGELRYGGPPVGALQALAPDLVVHLGSVSKTLAPGLRVGWVVGPPDLVDAVAARRAVEHGGAPALEPLALAAMIEAGDLDRHLRERRRAYRRRRELVVASLARHLPDAPRLGVPAGLHIPVVLGHRSAPHDLHLAALARGVLVSAQSGRWRDEAVTLVPVGFGRVADVAVDRAIARLRAAVDEVG